MKKHNYFVTFLKKINLLINRLLKKYLNKLNLNNLNNIRQSNKFFLIFVALFILFLSYLLIPNIHDEFQIRKKFNNQLLNSYNLQFNLPLNVKYNFFPRPHFTYENVTILEDQNEISKIKKLKIYVSLDNLFSIENIRFNDIIIENANFNLDSRTYNFFIKLLDKNFKEKTLVVKDSNIFFRNSDNEVLYINKIIKMKYNYDLKDLRNILTARNKIFNLNYSFELYNDKIKKKYFSKLNINFFKLQIMNEIDYMEQIKKGSANIIVKNNKSRANYELRNNSFTFNFFNKLDSEDFSYNGNINFKPFYSDITGKAKKLNLHSLIQPEAFIVQMIKTEILNNKNLDFNLKIKGNNIKNYENFKNILLRFKIKDGLLDLDDSIISWKDYVNFEILDSLIFIRDNELILDAKFKIIIKDSGEIYKSLLTPKNYRTEIKQIELSFNYNFDQKIINFKDIRVDNVVNQNLNKTLKKLMFKNDKLQNKVYFKNAINKAIKAYVG